MPKVKQYLALFCFLCCAVSLIHGPIYSPGYAQSSRTNRPPLQSRKDIRGKDYRYIKTHDLNNDGKVDDRDRLLWTRGKSSDYTKTYVSKENEDLLEIMDLDGDGDVEEWEMKVFYIRYDKNGNEILEDEEIEAAIEQE